MADIEQLRESYKAAGQEHVFRFWDRLNEAQRGKLVSQATSIDLGEVQRLVDSLVLGAGEAGLDYGRLQPAPYVPLPTHGGNPGDWHAAYETGETYLAEGKVAAFTVAGGQGTRLGFDGPKGTFPVTPVRQRTLFQVFADKVLATQERYGRRVTWYIMTSPVNHEPTISYFEDKGYLGLTEDQVYFFSQGTMPAVDFEGKILLAAPEEIALSPDGHGGSLRALVRSGATAQMAKDKVELISYFQVDNPLVRILDPAFIGFHAQQKSEMSSKMLPKAYPEEKVGVFCRYGNDTVVVEYSDLPDDLMQARDEAGNLRFLAGSIAIHLLNRDFVQRVGEGKESSFRLPFHKAKKKVPTVNEAGETVKPDEPNGIKFEMFVFDAIPFSQRPLILETAREEEFSPVKNAEGLDSPQTCRDDQIRQFTRWAKAAGASIPTDESGLPPFVWEISPRYADSAEALARRWEKEGIPEIGEGTVLA